MKIGIVGCGYVGKAVAKMFVRQHDITIQDPDAGEAGDVNRDMCDVVFVCVPTPMDESGQCDTSIVEAVVTSVKAPMIILKSTVAPGTTDAMIQATGKNIVFSPEYAGESSYWSSHAFHRDMVATPFFCFGGAPKNTSKCVDLYLTVAGPEKRYIQTTAKTAELAKYAENTFFATKIMFCYEFAKICEAHGADWNSVREVWLADPRINPMHTAAFARNERPFGGKCLPKDLSAIIESSSEEGHFPRLLVLVQDMNENWKKR